MCDGSDEPVTEPPSIANATEHPQELLDAREMVIEAMRKWLEYESVPQPNAWSSAPAVRVILQFEQYDRIVERLAHMRTDAGVCDECGGDADGPGDAHRVHCDCGDVVCSRCCQSYGGESYCRCCAERMRTAELEKRALDAWHGVRTPAEEET